MPRAHRLSSLACSLSLAAAGLLATGQVAAQSDLQKRYEDERAACTDGRSQQDRAACLREAGAARDAAAKGQLGGAADAQALRSARCERLPAEERAACTARLDGRGTVSGSVGAGGVLREHVERIPAAPATTAPQPTR